MTKEILQLRLAPHRLVHQKTKIQTELTVSLAYHPEFPVKPDRGKLINYNPHPYRVQIIRLTFTLSDRTQQTPMPKNILSRICRRLLFSSIGSSFLLACCVASAKLPEVAVMRFEGETRRLDVDLPKQSSLPVLRLLVADTLQEQVWLFTRIRKSDAIQGVVEWEENLWRFGVSGVTFAFQNDSKDPMWSPSNTALFIDPFGLEVTGPQKVRIATIASTCAHGRLKTTPTSEKLGELIYRRTAIDDLGLVSKKFRKGITVSSSWIEAIVDRSEFEVQSATLYDDEKPVEMIRGKLSLNRQDSVPVEIHECLAKLASQPLKGPWLSIVGDWEIVFTTSQTKMGKTLSIGDTSSFKYLPAEPIFNSYQFFPIEYREKEKVFRYLFEAPEDSPEIGGGGPRKAMCRINETGELEIIEAPSAADDFPTDFSEASIKKSVYLELKKKAVK